MEPSWSPPEHLLYLYAPFRGHTGGEGSGPAPEEGSECGHKVVVLDTSNRALLTAHLDVRSGAQIMA